MKKSETNKDIIILVVDDEQELCDQMEFWLERWGYKPITAGSGVEAIECLKTHKVDCIITDLQMTNGTGQELIEAVKEKNETQNIPVICTSGYTNMLTRDLFNMGAEALFVKPLKMEALEKFLEELLSDGEHHVKRSYPRVNCLGRAVCDVSGVNKKCVGEITNLSFTGLFVSTEGGETPGVDNDTVMDITLYGKNGEIQLKATGQIVWSTESSTGNAEPGFGVQFIEMSGTNQQILAEYINNYLIGE